MWWTSRPRNSRRRRSWRRPERQVRVSSHFMLWMVRVRENTGTRMSASQTFRDLVAWQRAMDITPEVYAILQQFPEFERFGLSDQIRRAVISVSANIAEGQGRHHSKEFVQFLGIARGSLSELESLLILANRLGYMTEQQLTILTDKIHSIRRPLHGLIEKFRHAEPSSPVRGFSRTRTSLMNSPQRVPNP